MDANALVVAEGLTLGVDGHEGDVGGVEGVHAEVRRAARVGRDAVEANALGDHAVVVGADADLGARRVEPVPVLGVGHHGDVHVIHDAELDELGLAAEELQLALASEIIAVLDLDEFLCRNDQQSHTPRQAIQYASGLEAHGDG